MAKINVAKQIVESLSPADAVNYASSIARRCHSVAADEDLSEGFRLGSVEVQLVGLVELLEAIDEKLNGPKSKVL